MSGDELVPSSLPAVTGAVAVESHRAVAEAIAARKVALANPRNPLNAERAILADCASLELAEEASYQFARGGTDIVGPSIRLLEVLARRWGNLECGVKELSRGNGYSDVLAYAIDLETGFTDKKEFQVKHWRDTKKGGYAVKDERDIYEIVANQGARRKRACLESIIPTDIKDKAMKACEQTLKAKVAVTPDRINSLRAKFEAIGVTQEMIEKRIQRKLDAIQPGHLVYLGRIYNSITNDMSTAADWFEAGAEGAPREGAASKTDQMAAELKAKAAAKTEHAPPPGSGESQGGASHASPSRPVAAAGQKVQEPREGLAGPIHFEEEGTGEITNDFVRKRITAAATQGELTTIMMGDLMKLPADDARTETMKLWNARSMELKPVQSGKEPDPVLEGAKPKPATSHDAPRPHGSAKVKAQIRTAMNKCTTLPDLEAAFAEVEKYAWDQGDRSELNERYRQCKEDLAV